MAADPLFVVFLLTRLMLLSLARQQEHNGSCGDPFTCGNLGEIHFPFKNSSWPPAECGFYTVNCSDKKNPKVQLKGEGHWYGVRQISQAGFITIYDTTLQKNLKSRRCESLESFGLPRPDWSSTVTSPNIVSLFKCKRSGLHNSTSPTSDFQYSTTCGEYYLYYSISSDRHLLLDGSSFPNFPQDNCSFIRLPARKYPANPNDFFSFFTAEFYVEVIVNYDCLLCRKEKHRCLYDKKQYPHCARKGNGDSWKWKLGLGIGVGFLGLFLIAIFIICCYKKRRASSNIFSRSTTDPYLNTDVEGGSCYFGVPVFPFNDLAKATNNFASEKELGDGGFGSVYHGKLKDGREVAVKRLYEHNYKRVEQFMNEIEILTRLRHRNLVSLYGCTSRHSRELLLVYEYIPNGTVADHLHGEQAKPGLLPWSIRMSIAIETATALAYLHASEIVHRDVKTNNILLDNNFTVKVADFGLSRLFPSDVTHISTAPQGTPGYVDPEYHQCYQLTSKSDVYSFGVVLIELISSMPAVDITRHRHEINLANLATSKIQKCEFHELIDPSTGFETDSEVRRMTIAVAELAFQCLQQNKEMRPSMEEVLETLKTIESRKDSLDENQEKEFDDITMIKSEQPPPPSPECDEVGLLKNMRPPASPISVTHKWPSTRSITPNVSG